MNHALRILFASGHTYLPQRAGGAESSTHDLCRGLIALGHSPAVMAALDPSGIVGWRSRLRKLAARTPLAKDHHGQGPSCRYPVYRGWRFESGSDQIRNTFRPDVVFVQCTHASRLARRWRELRVPVVFYLRDVEYRDFDPGLIRDPGVFLLANSRFVARRTEERFGVHPYVIPPLVHQEQYRVEPDPAEVLFVNPHPDKGMHLALEIARRLPQIRFRFVAGWRLPETIRASLEAEVGTLANVRLMPRVADMRAHYRKARIVIAPSQWEEAWGRIATEAQASGIPVLASDIGGLPESVGPGGLLLPPNADPDIWVSAIRTAFTDEPAYERLVQKARDHAARPEIQPGYLLEELENFIVRRISSADDADIL